MPDKDKTAADKAVTPRRPAATSQARENQLINLAYDLAEKQIRDGSASAQVTAHFLKLGSSRERVEQQRIKGEVHMLEIKAESIASQARIEDLYTEAMNSFRAYSGQEPVVDGEDFEDFDD